MSLKPPSIYLLLTQDDFALGGFLRFLISGLGDPAMADLNTTRLDGRQATPEEFNNAAFSMPFLAERRLVIFTNPLDRLGEKDGPARKRFIADLDKLPDTTVLALVLDDTYKQRRDTGFWETFSQNHWLMQWAAQAGDRVIIKEFALPSWQEMPGWIMRKTAELGGKMDPAAAQSLAEHVGIETRIAALEIEKLLTYVDGKHPVNVEDVDQLCTTETLPDVWKMTDALGEGNTRKALAVMHALLEVQEPLSLFAMVVRQFRLLLQVREAKDKGGGYGDSTSDVRRLTGYPLSKLESQAARFSAQRLEDIYHRLLGLDKAMKTGQIDPRIGLEIFVAEVG
ncbi:MAG TPA: DNA polymerase III subunit delta [Longilinea sp.]|nr:DNA polymerase III subunit delta [Longilinea sp.]